MLKKANFRMRICGFCSNDDFSPVSCSLECHSEANTSATPSHIDNLPS